MFSWRMANGYPPHINNLAEFLLLNTWKLLYWYLNSYFPRKICLSVLSPIPDKSKAITMFLNKSCQISFKNVFTCYCQMKAPIGLFMKKNGYFSKTVWCYLKLLPRLCPFECSRQLLIALKWDTMWHFTSRSIKTTRNLKFRLSILLDKKTILKVLTLTSCSSNAP